MTDRSEALDLLRVATDDQAVDFRDGQWEAIDALVNRRERLLVVQRTGWGKSSVYFLATRIFRDRGAGPTLIISPLLSLMRNQIAAAERLGIRALTINSDNRDLWPQLQRAVREDETDALLISPERLANDAFVEKILLPTASRIGLFVVDEAHCISDWGHDFRPDYQRLMNILQRMPANVPVLGTTATANDDVIKDVRAQLGDIGIQRGPLMRQSLALQTMRLSSKAERLAWLAEHIESLPGTGIIYTLTKRDADQVAGWLQDHDITAKAYYNGVNSKNFNNSDAYRRYLEDQFLENEIKALVATTALGMGYDKSDLGFVIHYQAPSSIAAYYQQIGRAGRGIKYATGILMSGDEDNNIHKYLRRTSFPREQQVNAILERLEESDGLNIQQLKSSVNLGDHEIEHFLKFLSVKLPAPIIKSGNIWRRTAVPYKSNHEKIRQLTKQRGIEWQQIQKYIDAKECLMKYLAEVLDDTYAQSCGKCASCLGQPIVDPSFTCEMMIVALRFLHHVELPLECNKHVAEDAFPEYGFQGDLPHELHAQTGRILSRWKDPGWGCLVAKDKKPDGRFRDELVDAVVEMLNERWKPTPPPKWVTCVPSKIHSNLVPDYAKRLAKALGLPFDPVVTKIKNNAPQKKQQNTFYQCRNLDGVFTIKTPISERPVLLVDDVVDSRWTLTVIAALLRRAGSGPVWPLALTTSRDRDIKLS